MVLRHNCGLAVAHTLHDVYSFIKALQHRGREAAGIAAIGDRIDVLKWAGGVDRFDVVDLHKIFPSTNYHTYMAHVRYATRGRKDQILDDAHPHVIGGRRIEKGSHVLIEDCDIACVHNGQVDGAYFSDLEKEILSTGCDTEALLHFFRNHGEDTILRQVPGAYTLAIADKRRKQVIVLRDRTGIRPGILGIKDGKHCVASEDIALRKNGGDVIEDLDEGVVYYLAPDGSYTKRRVVEQGHYRCHFEYNYLADKNSMLNGHNVRMVREALGAVLAEEFPPEALHPEGLDYVTFLPRCPEPAARVYAKLTDIPFLPVFYKMRGDRSFINSTSAERKKDIEANLFLLNNVVPRITGKRIGLIDDSTVRGNNAKRARSLLYDVAGVAEAYLINYTPPIGIIGDDGEERYCSMGIDMPRGDSFIARGRTREEISEEIGMSTLYISRQGQNNAYRSVGMRPDELCTFCIGGKHPFR